MQLPGQPDIVIAEPARSSAPTSRACMACRLVAGPHAVRQRAAKTVLQRASLNPANEGHNVLINEAAAARLGFTPQQAVGKTIAAQRQPCAGSSACWPTPSFDGAREPVKPTVYFYDPSGPDHYLRSRPRRQGPADTLAFIDKTWHTFAPTPLSQRHFPG